MELSEHLKQNYSGRVDAEVDLASRGTSCAESERPGSVGVQNKSIC